MKKISSYIAICLLQFSCSPKKTPPATDPNPEKPFLTYSINPQKDSLQLYWKDDSGQIIKTFDGLKSFVERQNKTLLFAMNGGMFKKDYSPSGLFIDKQKTMVPLDTASDGYGNFYLQPNGVFYLTTENTPGICTTPEFPSMTNIKYATQSGPMLIINGQINPAFKKGSNNLNIRNGVGILSDTSVVFVMSKDEINFFDFASYFQTMKCKNALYLDGFVSRAYLPEENWIQNDGKFGVMIGVTKENE